jgi:hypothetical protein
MSPRSLLSAALLLALIACDDDGGGTTSEHDALTSDIETACMHFEFGPHADATAASGADTPTATPHHHYTVTIPEGGGMVKLQLPEHGDYLVLLSDASVQYSVHAADGAVVDPNTSVDPMHHCAAAKAGAVYTLHGEPTLHLTGASSVELVLHGQLGAAHGHGG